LVAQPSERAVTAADVARGLQFLVLSASTPDDWEVCCRRLIALVSRLQAAGTVPSLFVPARDLEAVARLLDSLAAVDIPADFRGEFRQLVRDIERVEGFVAFARAMGASPGRAARR
jgi:hypothetical protein